MKRRLESNASRRARRAARRNHCARQAGPRARPQARQKRQDRPARDRRRSAGIHRPPHGRGIRLLRHPRLPDRRHPGDGLHARIRPQQLFRRHRPDRVEDAVGGPAQAAAQQGPQRTLPARLDDQADGRRWHCNSTASTRRTISSAAAATSSGIASSAASAGTEAWTCTGRSPRAATPISTRWPIASATTRSRRWREQLGLGQKFDLPVVSQNYGTMPDSEWKRAQVRTEQAPDRTARTGPVPTRSTQRSARAS